MISQIDAWSWKVHFFKSALMPVLTKCMMQKANIRRIEKAAFV
jgi:hypothetical protein